MGEMTKMSIFNSKSNPRPFIIAGYTVIALTFGVVGGWAATAQLDRAVIAPGMIDVASNRKQIQHLEGGVIEEILVKEGSRVKAGDVLMRLNDVQARANVRVYEIRLHIAQAMEARLLAERRMEDSFDLPVNLQKDVAPEVQAAIVDQREIFADRISVLNSQVSILKSRIEQLRRESEGLEQQKRSFQERVQILSERLERLRPGLESGIVQANIFATYEDEYIEVKANIARMETEKAKVEKSIGETEFQILQTQQQYKERASSEYKDVSGELKELTERLLAAQDILRRTRITSPVDGTVERLQFHTVGGVIKPGDIVSEILPTADRFVIEARVAPIDIDSVHPGLQAEVKLTAFPGRFMPIVTGEVDSVSKVTIDPKDGKTAPYFRARINVSKGMVPDDIEERLTVDMPADVIITTGERTVIDYLTSPLTDAIYKSMREE
ncbi:HlyD family type I secretion periplasmic adaptor subunit [Pseudorhizobium flavum]|uniref:HlyD family type I secretion periplasmic adaptor subunit n=1 Tax=Pseudorhizobium flavum TaxID=1335061 RepID=UPI002491D957|nr:HlyD family type I secretion periplasmic adaptor subunit [Pseudorhizobium flavum]